MGEVEKFTTGRTCTGRMDTVRTGSSHRLSNGSRRSSSNRSSGRCPNSSRSGSREEGGPQGGTVFQDQHGNFYTGRWVVDEHSGGKADEGKEEEVMKEEETHMMMTRSNPEYQEELSRK